MNLRSMAEKQSRLLTPGHGIMSIVKGPVILAALETPFLEICFKWW